MTPRVRRLLAIGAVIILLLFTGRWTVDIMAARWWALSVSPLAGAFVTRWVLLGLALDFTAIIAASAWFATQAILVARVIATVKVQRDDGPHRVLAPVATRYLLIGGAGLGILLGVITGAGAREWRAPLALAWQGVSYGINDPLLGRDLGVLLAQLPLWRVVHSYALMLVLLGLLLAAVLYTAIGAIKRQPATFYIHHDARRHLGLLLGLLAVVIAVGSLLTPYRLAVSADPPLGVLASTVRVVAAQALAGASLGVAAMSVAWAFRPRHSLVVAGWLVLLVGGAVERFLIPAFAAEGSGSPTRDQDLRDMAAQVWGIELSEELPTDFQPSLTARWDEATLARSLAVGGPRVAGVWPAMAVGRDSIQPRWTAATLRPDAQAELEVLTIRDGAPAASLRHPEVVNRRSLTDARIMPEAAAWRLVADHGVAAGWWAKRLGLAWARQSPGMLQLGSDQLIDWHLDPVERARTILPMLSWRLDGLFADGERAVWVATGFATVGAAPLMTTRSWGGRDVAGVTPAIIAVIDIRTGAVSFTLDPSAGPLGKAWAEFIGPLVVPDSALEASLRHALPYPATWLESQLEVLEGSAWNLGQRPGRRVADGPPETPWAGWNGNGLYRQAIFEDPARRSLSAIITASRHEGQLRLGVVRYEGSDLDNTRELDRRWNRGVTLTHLRDSVRAAGDSLLAGPVHWHLESDGLVAWTSYTTEGRRDPLAALWLATARGSTLGGGRDAASAWQSLTQTTSAPTPQASMPDASERLDALRSWIGRADSALVRGDMTAFGRAWEALRGLARPTESP